ncbi:hypothetical protein AB4345_05325 [Vibrio breoganii]
MACYVDHEVSIDVTKVVEETVLCSDDLHTILFNVDSDMIEEFAKSVLGETDITDEQLKTKLRSMSVKELADVLRDL